MQKILKVAIQGDRASFHEIAAKALYKQPIELSYCMSFEDVFKKLWTGEIDKALVATSNSAHGTIKEVEALINRRSVKYESEYHLPIQQHLIGLPGTDINKVSKILSHPVALSQCSTYIQGLCDITIMNYHDTAAAVEYVKMSNDQSIVAIASASAAELHGLAILKHAVQDDPHNTTVFKSFSLL